MIPILVKPADIPDKPREGEDIIVEVWGLCMGREIGPSGMMEYNLKGWLREATWEKYPGL